MSENEIHQDGSGRTIVFTELIKSHKDDFFMEFCRAHNIDPSVRVIEIDSETGEPIMKKEIEHKPMELSDEPQVDQ